MTDAERVTERLMTAYDRSYPDASPFSRGDWEFKCRQVISAIEAVGGSVHIGPDPDTHD